MVDVEPREMNKPSLTLDQSALAYTKAIVDDLEGSIPRPEMAVVVALSAMTAALVIMTRHNVPKDLAASLFEHYWQPLIDEIE